MAQDYRARLRNELPSAFLRTVNQLVRSAHIQGHQLAKREFSSNIPWHRGTATWGKAEDALYEAARQHQLPVRRVPAENGQTHTEVLSGDLVLTIARGEAGEAPRPAKYREQLSEMNNPSPPTLFDDTEWHSLPKSEPATRLFAVLTHASTPGDPSPFFSIWIVIPGPPGTPVLASIPLTGLLDDGVEAEPGVELIDDTVAPTLRSPAAKSAT